MIDNLLYQQSINGLSEAEAASRLQHYGSNIFKHKQLPQGLRLLASLIRQPMFLLLVLASVVYFLLGEASEAYIMLLAIILVSGISFFQELRSNKALKALKTYSEPKGKVIRDGGKKIIAVADMVPGDILLLEEGDRIPADAVLLQQSDFSVDEAILSGEAFPVEKSADSNNKLFQGTLISSGSCLAKVTATGNDTRLSRLGKSMMSIAFPKTLLQQQLNAFEKKMAIAGALAFIIILLINFYQTNNIVASILYSLTLAMSIIPEEIPVAFSTFMALGAYRMSRNGIIVKQPQTIESLGIASVICLDKTGTITENSMQLIAVYDYNNRRYLKAEDFSRATNIIAHALLASEITPFDSMEKAIQKAYANLSPDNMFSSYHKIHEYPLSGKPPMMTHIYEKAGKKLAAAKGAVERIMKVCRLNNTDRADILREVKEMASKGWRVLGICRADFQENDFPASQDDYNWQFLGLMAFYDPPRNNINQVFRNFYAAGIDIKIITGDFSETAQYIARETGLRNAGQYLRGEQVMVCSEAELQEKVKTVTLFTRMSPEAKLKVIEAIKANGEIVAMTGDGVNDGPALKAAHIGIAMGLKGTNFSRQVADLIITDDDLSKIVSAIEHGRRIYENLKKAIRYIISIHIPIILIVCIPLILNWKVLNIFTPIHIIFLELIMGPTCSIFFENEPAEKNVMQHGAVKRAHRFFTTKELSLSILQGLFITAGVLFVYQSGIIRSLPVAQIRTNVFVTLILSNILLTIENRSFSSSFIKNLFYKNSLLWLTLSLSFAFLIFLLTTTVARELFKLSALAFSQIVLLIIIALISVLWLELYKLFNAKKLKRLIHN